VASCSRHNLNYQSTHTEGNVPDQTSYSSAPAQAPAANYNQQQDNYTTNYNNQVNYNSPSYQTFYDELSPYGYWVNNPSYGYVWVPNMGPEFSPYCTNGHWVFTDYGWTWASDYSWGWAPFHYGRWTRDAMYGWMWVPGNQWGPAWVTWGQTPGYYGWAPMSPGVVAYEGYRPPAEYWNYVPAQNIGQPNVSSYTIRSYSNNNSANINYENVTIINNHRTYNQATYNSGPHANEIENVTGNKITPVIINNADKPVKGGGTSPNQLNLYRPTINQSGNAAVPAKITPVQNIKPVNNTTAPNTHGNPQPINHNNSTQPGNPGNPTQPLNGQRPVAPVNQTPAQPNPRIINETPNQTTPRSIQNERPLGPPAREQPKPVQPIQIERPVEPVREQPKPVQPVQIERPVEPIREQPRPTPERTQPEPIRINNPTPVPQNTPVNRPQLQFQSKPQPQAQPRPKPQPQSVKPQPKPAQGKEK